MGKLVLYVSRTGTTEKIAKELAKRFNADLIQIIPEREYGSYFNALMRVIKEKVANEQASSGTEYRNFTGFDTVFVGFPIWAGDIPTFLQDFLQNSEFGGVTLVPFATSRITGISQACVTLKKLCPGAKIKSPYVYNKKTEDEYANWIVNLVNNLP
ncbi:MAG: hypothetical protein IJI83_01490 [Oscillospiraceae bacterium]|nr:hypothetical protein [Oscillospiraceae bacterium]